MIAYDLDGVISREPFYLSILFDHINIKWGIAARNYQKVLYRPIQEGFIITGRPELDREVTEAWLDKWDIKYTSLFMSPHFDETVILKFKSDTINRLNIKCYIESELKIIEHLSPMCPNCTFFLPSNAGNCIVREK